MKRKLQAPSFALAALICSLVAASVQAQPYPAKPIRVIVATAAGGGSDIPARLIASVMEKRLAQSIVIENRPGANTTIGTSAVVKAAPDGYTLLFGGVTSPHPIYNPANGVDAGKELAPVANLISLGSSLVFVNAKNPAGNFQDLVTNSKARELKYGAISPGQELSMAALQARTGIRYAAIPFKTETQLIAALLSQDIDMAFSVLPAVYPFIQDNRIRALFIANPRRHRLLPNVPTSTEAGIQNFNVTFNNGFWAPLGTSKEIIARLNAEANAVVAMPEIIERLRTLGLEPIGSTPEEQLRAFDADMRFWTEAVKIAAQRK